MQQKAHINHYAATWREAALICALRRANTQAEFSADDLWDDLDSDYPGLKPNDPRDLGGVFAELQQANVIRKAGEQTSRRREMNHGRTITVWASKVFRTR